MALSADRKEKYQQANKQEYGDQYCGLRFPEHSELASATAYRRELLSRLSDKVMTGCLGTKLDMENLSPGCRTCVAGEWSCLFINGKCNGSCFYCPASQNKIGQPSTNGVTFTEPRDYVAYLERFKFRGASISGGEPLLTAETSLRFIRAIKKYFGDQIHVWLYTNGILANREMMMRLRDAGLDEIRFDIGATAYNLRQLEQAAGLISTITVEIPAIAEDRERLKGMLRSLHDAGVRHLNLHQLRLTPHNCEKLLARGYRFLHGEKVTVLDSELAALEILLYGMQHDIDLPINYCAFPYKNRFQARAARCRNAPFIIKGHEAMTQNGFIRTLTLQGDTNMLMRCCAAFDRSSDDKSLWKLGGSQDKLHFHPSLWPCVDAENCSLTISYSAAYQRQSPGYRNPFVNVELSRKKKIAIERETHQPSYELSADQARDFAKIYFNATAEPPSPAQPGTILLRELAEYERTPEGLAEYY